MRTARRCLRRRRERLANRQSPVAWLVLLVILLAGVAWLTQDPESKLFEQAERWPLVGPWVRSVRRAYLPPRPGLDEKSSAEASGPEVVVVYRPSEEALATSFVWVRPGTEMHGEPDQRSPVLHEVTSLSHLPVLERRGDWYRVSLPLSGFERQRGWMWLEDYQDPSPEALREPDPVLPLPARGPDPEAVLVARRFMDQGGAELDCGGYVLFTDSSDRSLQALCARIATQVEEIYPRRYGLTPVSPPAEVIFLFRRRDSYQNFDRWQNSPTESRLAHAAPARGYLAIYHGDRSVQDVLGSLVHEMAHLTNRRTLGPALPPWLAEGLADDLGESKITADGSILPGVLSGETSRHQLKIIRRGGVAAAIDLQSLLEDDELPTLAELLEMDREHFYDRQKRRIHYALSSFWVRYLLSDFGDGGMRSGFQTFLQGIARGRLITGDRLLESLGTDWQTLESGFRVWLHLQFLMPPDETRSESP